MTNRDKNISITKFTSLKFALTFTLSCTFISLISAQINIKIGYIPALGSFSEINDLLNNYNEENAESLENPFSEMRFMHGIEVGVRYKLGNLALEMDWSNLNREKDALLYFKNSDSFSDKKYNFSFNSFSFNIDNYIDRFGFGLGIYSQKLSINREIGSNELRLVSERNYALDFHLNFVLQSSNTVSFVIKPYYRLALGSYHLQAFHDDLLAGSTTIPESQMNFFGLRLLFYNGRQ